MQYSSYPLGFYLRLGPNYVCVRLNVLQVVSCRYFLCRASNRYNYGGLHFLLVGVTDDFILNFLSYFFVSIVTYPIMLFWWIKFTALLVVILTKIIFFTVSVILRCKLDDGLWGISRQSSFLSEMYILMANYCLNLFCSVWKKYWCSIQWSPFRCQTSNKIEINARKGRKVMWHVKSLYQQIRRNWQYRRWSRQGPKQTVTKCKERPISQFPFEK